MKHRSDPYNVPSEREFATSMVLTGAVILVIAVTISAGVTWSTTRFYEPAIHHQAVRTAVLLPLLIVPLCTAIIGYQGYTNHRKMLAVSHLARTDEMTGLANRRAFMHTANTLFSETNFEYSGLGIFIIDLDHFKQVNDVHGHATGDKVLSKMVAIASNVLRQEDLIGRLGGEEFAIVLVDSDAMSAAKVADRIRQAIKQVKFPSETGPFNVSVSIGVAEPLFHEASINDALERADAALYNAKRNGRDRVEIAPENVSPHGHTVTAGASTRAPN